MFSLIITIISIALVAVLALATLYYGGDAFNKGSADAQAAKIVNQGQQLLGAAEMFFVDNKAWPTDVQALIAGGYLKSAPVAYQGNGTVAQAWAAAEWAMPVAGQPVFVADVDATATCQAVNKRTVGLDGILARAHTSLITQCYGTAESSLKAVAAKNTEAMQVVANPATVVAVTGLLPASDVTADAAPTAASPSTVWLAGFTPTVTSGSGGGGGGGSITPPSSSALTLSGFGSVTMPPQPYATAVISFVDGATPLISMTSTTPESPYSQVVTVTNSGAEPLTLTYGFGALFVDYDDLGLFADGSCVTSPVLAAGQSCQYQVYFITLGDVDATTSFVIRGTGATSSAERNVNVLVRTWT